MRACVLYDVKQMEVREVPRPVVGPYDVLVRTTAVGLCGTDLHIFIGEANYNTDERGQPVPLAVHPQIPGHEVTGIVEEAGREVRDISIGDRVIFDQGLNCFSARRMPLCEYCKTDHSHQCEFFRELGITGDPGGLADFVLIPAINAVRLNSDLDPVEAALTEPLACIVHSSNMVESAARARYSMNADEIERRVKSVLIFGAGPAGLLFTQYLRNVIGFDGLLMVSEPNARKRDLAARFGADVIDPQATDMVEAVAEKTKGRRVEYVIDASGAGQVFRLIPSVARKQATLLLYGHGHGGVDLSVLNSVQFLEPAIISPSGGSGGFEADGKPSTYLKALRLIEQGTIKVAPLVTHRYRSLEAVTQALTVDYYKPDYVKGVVTLA